MSRMFPFITRTLNPIIGECPFKCTYCWTKKLKNMRPVLARRYRGPPRLDERSLLKTYTEDDFVFVGTMRDLFSPEIPLGMLADVFYWIKDSKAQFLLLTKNPRRLYEVLTTLRVPHNCKLGATIESDIDYPDISKAPGQTERLNYMRLIKSDFPDYETFISNEPTLKATPFFPEKILQAKPWAVAVGYDNYRNRLPEPPLESVEKMVKRLEWQTKVYTKTMRPAWWEDE